LRFQADEISISYLYRQRIAEHAFQHVRWLRNPHGIVSDNAVPDLA